VASRLCCWWWLTGERLGRWSTFLLLLCVFFFYFVSPVTVFSVFLLLPASVCCFSFLLLFLMVAAVVGEAMVVLLYGDGQCLLLFFHLCRGVSSFFFKGVAVWGGRWLEVDGGAAGGCWPVELLWRWRGRNSAGPRDEERFFFLSMQRPQSLFLYIFSSQLLGSQANLVTKQSKITLVSHFLFILLISLSKYFFLKIRQCRHDEKNKLMILK